MQKIEKWRVEELALLLNEFASLLKKADNSEWASVFTHFHEESQKLFSKEEFDLESLIKLIKNIKNCFSGSQYFTQVISQHENLEERTRTNQSLSFIRARLFKILKELEQRVIEFAN